MMTIKHNIHFPIIFRFGRNPESAKALSFSDPPPLRGQSENGIGGNPIPMQIPIMAEFPK
jgi:hypothetical protein